MEAIFIHPQKGKNIKMGIYIEPRSANTRSAVPIFYFVFRAVLNSNTQYAKMKICWMWLFCPNVLNTLIKDLNTIIGNIFVLEQQ